MTIRIFLDTLHEYIRQYRCGDAVRYSPRAIYRLFKEGNGGHAY